MGRVEAHRYKCTCCHRIFRHYPQGVTAKDQSQRTVVLAALMYGLGLSCSAASHLLRALGVEVSKMSVWRDAQEAGEALRRKRPVGKVWVLGADETVYKVSGQEVVVGFLTDAGGERTLGFEVLTEGDGHAVVEWLEPYARELGAEVLVSDDNDSYGLASAELGLSHQLCLAHVRKYVTRRSKSILEQALRGVERGRGGEIREARRGSRVAKAVTGGTARGRWQADRTVAPKVFVGRTAYQEQTKERKEAATKKASAGYRMRMLTFELSEKWHKICLHLSRPELGLDGTNNATERAIGKSKVRYKSMRGYKSPEGMTNGIALTQWLYSGEDEHALAKEMAA